MLALVGMVKKEEKSIIATNWIKHLRTQGLWMSPLLTKLLSKEVPRLMMIVFSPKYLEEVTKKRCQRSQRLVADTSVDYLIVYVTDSWFLQSNDHSTN